MLSVVATGPQHLYLSRRRFRQDRVAARCLVRCTPKLLANLASCARHVLLFVPLLLPTPQPTRPPNSITYHICSWPTQPYHSLVTRQPVPFGTHSLRDLSEAGLGATEDPIMSTWYISQHVSYVHGVAFLRLSPPFPAICLGVFLSLQNTRGTRAWRVHV